MKRLIIIALLIGCTTAFAQSNLPRKEVRQGNRLYKTDKYEEAETAYRKALDKDSTYYKAQYNLGNSLYKKKNYNEAAKHFEVAASNPSLNKKEASKIQHNLGNSYLQAGLADRQNGMDNFQKAVNSYQQALLKDPKNENTRYNYSYAKKMLQKAQQQQQQQQGGGDNQNQDQNQKNKDQQNQQGQQNQQNQNQQDQQQNQQNQQQQQQQGQQGKQDQKDQKQQQAQQQKEQKKQDAERLLEAVNNNEKKTMKEHQKQLEVGRPVHTDKDW